MQGTTVLPCCVAGDLNCRARQSRRDCVALCCRASPGMVLSSAVRLFAPYMRQQHTSQVAITRLHMLFRRGSAELF